MSDVQSRKPLLALTALVVFGYVAIITQEVCIRNMSFIIIVNAFFCHVGGFILWDVFCNAILIVLTLYSASNRQTILSIIVVGVVAWLLNHFFINDCLLHAILVQGGGALALKLLKLA